ncbi:MAG: phosphatase PAP2 family protein [Chloroflexi bacterium]|nr:phosphatase PAP2 family protein [Chloroflexota bacterium]
MTWDWHLFLAINQLAGQSQLLDAAGRFFVEDAFMVFPLLLIALWFVLGRARWLWVALGALIGVARVFVGVHYPIDVLDGAALGATWGLLALAFAPSLALIETPLLERLARWRLA